MKAEEIQELSRTVGGSTELGDSMEVCNHILLMRLIQQLQYMTEELQEIRNRM